ncbi:MAG: hypothetical protein MUF69_10285, partial [Desulfobacterota bacterium]|nr:hypothetical protein [Thermodesulfobacteriota bacterium]
FRKSGQGKIPIPSCIRGKRSLQTTSSLAGWYSRINVCRPVLAGRAESPRTEQDYLVGESFGNRAVRQGDWKFRWGYKPLGKGDKR